jgi:Ca-activated chloride channel family protein
MACPASASGHGSRAANSHGANPPRWLPVIALAILLVVTGPHRPTIGWFAWARAQTPQDRPLFSTTTQLVVLNVTVADRKGRYVGGLSKDAFWVFEDAQSQTISLFASEDAPVTVGLLIDSSGSMRSNLGPVIAAAVPFVEISNPADEVFALTFNDDVRAVLPAGTLFTNDAGRLRDALSRAVVARGRTALYDAIAQGLVYASKGSHARKVLVIVSDGGDNASDATFDQILRDALRSNVVIYTVGLIDELDTDADPKRLKQLAETTGGEAFRPRDVRQITTLLPQIARDLRHAYTIGYVPAPSNRSETFRRVRVAARSSTGEPLVVRTRAGYLAQP